MTGRTFIIDPAVQGQVSVVTERPLSRSEYFELFLSTLRANGLVAVPAAGGALRIQPVAGAAASAPVGGSRRASAERLRHRDLPGAADRGGAGGRDAAAAGQPRRLDHRQPQLDRRRRFRRQCPPHPPGARPDRRATTARPGSSALDNAGAREIARGAVAGAGARTASSVVPVDSSNSIALRGDAATVARLVGDRRASSTGAPRAAPRSASSSSNMPTPSNCCRCSSSCSARRRPSPPPRRSATPAQRRRGAARRRRGAADHRPARPRPRRPAPAAPAPAARRRSAARNAVVTRFEGANAIVISAPPDVQRTLGEVIRQLDVRREQVLVEAIIVEISDAAAQQLGVQLFLAGLRGIEHPVRDHQLFQHRAQYRHDRRRDRARASWAARRRRSPPATARRPRPRPARGSDADRGGGGGARRDQRRPRRLRACGSGNAHLRRDHQRGALRQPVEHPVDAVDHDARQSGSADPRRAGNPDHHRRGAVRQFRQCLPHRAAPECRHHAGGEAADQRRRRDQARHLRQEVSSIAGPVSTTIPAT